MRLFSSTTWVLVILILLQIATVVRPQSAGVSEPAASEPAETKEPEPTPAPTTEAPAPTTAAPQPSATKEPAPSSQEEKPAPSKTAANPSPSSNDDAKNSDSNAKPTNGKDDTKSDNSNPTATDEHGNTTGGPEATETSKDKSSKDGGDDDSTPIGTIAGAVVGGWYIIAHTFLLTLLVGVALLGGIITWLNRRGGCTRRSTKPNKADYEDFGMSESDYPHHRSPSTPVMGAAAAAAVATPAVTHSNVSPTVPQLNEHGTYYDGHPSGYYHQDMASQQQQGYYYPEQQGMASATGYYDNSGYYYDQQQHQQVAGAGMYAQDPGYMQQENIGYYKPDLADLHTDPQHQQMQQQPQMQQHRV
ncbi:hypothetical protein BJV82DRAFT_674784 [Fennellomyces sp. T-0311]|nr:hypothetical protein BJV82DRAFT_674784 [Fennellomyces sp. T-0311]